MAPVGKFKPISGLTPNEQRVADLLADAWGGYVALDRQHPDELAEFRHAIHLAQGLLATRIARRAYPEYWPTYNSPEPTP